MGINQPIVVFIERGDIFFSISIIIFILFYFSEYWLGIRDDTLLIKGSLSMLGGLILKTRWDILQKNRD